MLIFEGGTWEGESRSQRVVLTSQAFQREVVAYLFKQGITVPTSEQTSAALRAIRAVSYWTPERNAANDIHVMRRKTLLGEALPLPRRDVDGE